MMRSLHPFCALSQLKRSLSRGWFVAILALLLLPASLAFGQRARDQARVLFREGDKLFAKGDYAGALDWFQKAKALYPSYKIDLNIATTLVALGRLPEAAESYELFLRSPSGEIPKELLAVVSHSLEDLRRKLSAIEILCRHDGAAISVDAKSIGVTPRPIPIYVLPGAHLVEVKKAKLPPFRRSLELSAGEMLKVTVVFGVDDTQKQVKAPTPPEPTETPVPTPPSEPEVATPAPEKPAAPVPRSAPPETTDAAPKPSRGRTIAAFTTLGVGVACLATAGALYGVGFTQKNAAYDDYQAARTQADIDGHWADVEKAHTLTIVGHVAAGVGAAALGVSLYLFLTRSPAAEAPPPRAAQRLPQVTLSASAHAAAVFVTADF